jgi:hypothetical protein
MCCDAKGAIVIDFTGCVGMGNLDEATHQDQRNANNSQQS